MHPFSKAIQVNLLLFQLVAGQVMGVMEMEHQVNLLMELLLVLLAHLW